MVGGFMARVQNSSLRIQYINEKFAKEDQKQQVIRKQLQSDNKEGINVDAYEGQLLKLLALMVKAKKIVEIGTLYGYSTTWLLQALPDGGKLYSLEKSPENYEKAKSLIQDYPTKGELNILLGDALENLDSITAEGPFDLIFIDANKAGYKKYLDWAVKNVSSGGLIVGDNTFLFGHVVGEESSMNANEKQIKVMQDFNAFLAESPEFESVMIPTPEGMTLGLKK